MTNAERYALWAKQARQRSDRIAKLYATGRYSMAEIGHLEGGISRQRIHQILQKVRNGARRQ